MSLSTVRFLDLLEREGLLEDAVLANLRRQVAESNKPISAEAVAKLLVDKGELTAFQAKKLLQEDGQSPSPGKASPASDYDELGLADEEPPQGKQSPATTSDEEIVDLEVVGNAPTADEDMSLVDEGLTPISEGLTPLGEELTPFGDELTPLGGGLTPLGGGLTPLGDSSGLTPMGSGLQPLDDLSMAGGATAAAPQRGLYGAPPKKKVRRNQWDSPLLLYGGGGLILLVIAMLFLWFILTRGTANELFELAEEDYRAQSYSNAIEKYEKFLSKYPDNEKASLVRVRYGMARLRQAVEGSKDWQRSLDLAREILPQIQNEEKFIDAGPPELASLLPAVAAGFTQQAKDAQSTEQAKEKVDLAEQAMELVNNGAYVTADFRKSQEATIDGIKEDIALVHREIRQGERLVEDLQKIQQAVAAGKTAEAYTIRKALIKEYPALETNEELNEVVLAITQKERDLVKIVEQPLPAQTTDVPPSAEFRVVLSGRSGETISSLNGRVAMALVGGAVYGLDAASGKVLWRRYVGHETKFHPAALSNESGGAAILVDGRRNELVRLQAADGQLVWRLPVGEPFADPVITPQRIYAATASGRLLEVDAASGQSPRHAVVPQPLPVGPSVDAQRPQLYQIGEHSNLYVISADDLQCREVFYVGHKAGGIVVPPVMTLGHLFVAENAAADSSLLHIIATNASGLALKTAQEPIRIRGQVVVPPVLYGRRVLVVTDLGAIHIFEVEPANKSKPVTDILKFAATPRAPVISYPLADGGQLFIADQRLSRFEIQTSLGKLNRSWIVNDGDTFIAPLQLFGAAVVHVRRRQGSPGATVSAVNTSDGRPLWETDLGAPLAGRVEVDLNRKLIVAVTAEARLFEIGAESLKAGYLDQPTATAGVGERGLAFSRRVDLTEGRLAFANPQESQRILVYEPAPAGGQLRLVKPNLPAANLTTEPMFFQDGLLLPCSTGQVYLIDMKTGGNRVLPFQPPLEADAEIAWRRPAVLDTGDQFVISDSRSKLYRVGIKTTPQPFLASAAPVALDSEIVSPLAAVADTVYGVARGTDSDTVVSYSLPDLKPGPKWPLDGRLAWGPERVGDVVFLASDSSRLICLEAGQKPRWATTLNYGPLAGRPLLEGGDFLLAFQSGMVTRVSAATGEEKKAVQIGEPLGEGPVVFGTRLLLSGRDGTLYVIPMLASS